jgi:hypothetical protein
LAIVILIPILLVGVKDDPPPSVFRLKDGVDETCIEDPIVLAAVGRSKDIVAASRATDVRDVVLDIVLVCSGVPVGSLVIPKVGRNMGRFGGRSIVTPRSSRGRCCSATIFSAHIDNCG